jgi:NADPH-dependent ferric siderophore reductase
MMLSSLVRVEAVRRITPHMVRVTFAGRLAADRPVRLFFPEPRTFTIRTPDPLQIDFVLHRTGPATTWARSAVPGQQLRLAPAAAGTPLPASLEAADWLLLVGDETALPAIGTILEARPPGARAVAFVEVRDEDEEQPLASAADLTVHWVHRWTYGSLARSVRTAPLPPGQVFAWVAGEAGLVRTVRRVLVGERGLPERSVETAEYWSLALR